tara:strand:- start:330 stop:1583 length:1254 start_codon:yes stop_codon:yes gene_type:complete
MATGNYLDRGQINNPRFYVDRGKYLQIKGFRHETYFSNDADSLFDANSLQTYGLSNSLVYKMTDLNPLTPVIFNTKDLDIPIKFCLWLGSESNSSGDNLSNLRYLGILGHNFDSANCKITFDILQSKHDIDGGDLSLTASGNGILGANVPASSILNWGANSLDSYKPNDGTTIIDLDGTLTEHSMPNVSGNWFFNDNNAWGIVVTLEPASSGVPFMENINIGAFSYGSYYQMPFSPDMTSNFSVKNEGVKKQKTIGGATVTNTLYTGSPDWPVDTSNRDTRRPFSSHDIARVERHEGRRVWDMNYTAMFDYELFSPNIDHSFSQVSDDFYSVVVSKTLSGQLPFIFEYNTNTISSSDYNTYDDTAGDTEYAGFGDNLQASEHMPHHFCLARFESNEFSADQIAPGIWSFGLTIEETW